jgi:hypothetical protein
MSYGRCHRSVIYMFLVPNLTMVSVDPQGIRVNKAVRFRIEFRPVTPSTSSTPYLTNSLSSNSYNERSSASASYSHWNTQIVATASPRPVSTVGSDQRQYTKKHGESNGSSNSEASMACALVFVQEKGAYSALKSIHQAMKNMWKYVCFVQKWIHSNLCLD